MGAASTNVASRPLTMLVMCLALFMSLLESTALSLVLPAIQADLRADLASVIWVANAFMVVFAALLLPAGALGDRWGPAPTFLVGVAVFTTGSAVCAYAPDLEILIVGRLVQGIGAALVVPQTLAILTLTFPGSRDRAKAFGIWSGVSGLALILGPVIGGVLAHTWGWRAVFLINLPIGLLTLLLGAAVLRSPELRGSAKPDASLPQTPRPGLDPAGQLLTITGLGALTFTLIEGSRLGWLSPLIITCAAIAVAALTALVVVERRVRAPMIRLELFRYRTFAAAAAVLALTAFGMYAAFLLLSLLLQQVLGYTPAEAGIRFLPAMLSVIVASLLGGLVAGRLGSRLPTAAGTALIGGSLLLISQEVGRSDYQDWWPLLILLGLGIGLTIPPAHSALMGSVPSERTAIASATGETGKQVGALVGIAVLTALVTAGYQRTAAAGADSAGLTTANPADLARIPGEGLEASTDSRAEALVIEALASGIRWGLLAAAAAAFAATLLALFIREERGAASQPADAPTAARGTDPPSSS
ncbi:MFS transporter [Natronosporangium hydrolyticum]|uniref:MFS transporter n=1 Tax=Natronosporangium hydrolyticum TaxID=2811111 RepID=A0A895Y8E8_9ACTN|nr:MFS transporter [Natronosporangium hydrolyticum]QSB13987.1 MFS transporter [Natronosporangium hydrolyticum]